MLYRLALLFAVVFVSIIIILFGANIQQAL